MYMYFAKILKVHDGDTFFAEVDLGFHVKKQMWLRLAGVDTPELSTPEGKMAREFVVDWLFREKRTDMPQVVIETLRERDGDEKSTFGRYVATVCDANGRSLADALTRAGHLKAKTKVED